ncbi:MAG: hypothetical protein V8R63_06685 [Thomasclavelia ramosa]
MVVCLVINDDNDMLSTVELIISIVRVGIDCAADFKAEKCYFNG